MRVGLLIYGSLDTLSGGYLYDRMLVHHLGRAGDEICILSLPWHSYPRHLLHNLSWRLGRRLRDLSVDILLQDELNHPSLFAVNRLRRPSTYPVVSIVHHLRVSEDHARWKRPLYRLVEKAYLRSVDGFVFNSETTRRSVVETLGGEPSGVVARPGVDHLPLPTRDEVAHLIAGRRQRSGPLRLLSVGNLIARKGLHRLLPALARIPAHLWHLDVVGSLDTDPGYVSRLRRQIRHLGLEDQVLLHGRLETARLVDLYRAADLFVLLSYEGYGIVYLEAMAFGLPVAGSRAGGAGEIVGAESGILLDPTNEGAVATALHRLCEDRAELAHLGAGARRRFESHPTWSDTARIVRDYLQGLCYRAHTI